MLKVTFLSKKNTYNHLTQFFFLTLIYSFYSNEEIAELMRMYMTYLLIYTVQITPSRSLGRARRLVRLS